MKIWQGIILGIVQGIAQMLPISGSGHRQIFGTILGLPDAGSDEMLLFNAMLHFGALFAVMAAYWRDILRLLLALLEILHLRKPDRRRRRHNPDRRTVFLLLAGVLPLVLAVFLRDWTAALGTSLFFVGAMLLVNGLVLYFSGRYAYGEKTDPELTLGDAMLIGAAQLVSVVPGLSRSGLTVAAGMRRGCDRDLAVKFSFLLSIPAYLAAAVSELIGGIQAPVSAVSLPLCFLSMAVSAVFGYAAIKLLRFLVQKNLFGKFAYYCWGAGLVALVLALIYV